MDPLIKYISKFKIGSQYFIRSAYEKMYVLEPGEQKQVEALSSPIGLKIAIVYDAAPEGQYLLYQRWEVKINSILTITYVNGGDISTFGGCTQ